MTNQDDIHVADDIIDRADDLIATLAEAHGDPGLVGALIADTLGEQHGSAVIAAAMHNLFGYLVTADPNQARTYRV